MIPEMIQRLLGESEGASVLEKIEACEVSVETTICQLRGDLSRLPPENAPPRLFSSVAVFEAFQTIVGSLRQYYVVVPIETLAELDGRSPAQLLQDAFGAEGVSGLSQRDRRDRADQSRDQHYPP